MQLTLPRTLSRLYFLGFCVLFLPCIVMANGHVGSGKDRTIQGMIDGVELSIPVDFARLLEYSSSQNLLEVNNFPKSHIPEIDSFGFEVEYPSLRVSTPLMRVVAKPIEEVIFVRVKSLNSVEKQNYLEKIFNGKDAKWQEEFVSTRSEYYGLEVYLPKRHGNDNEFSRAKSKYSDRIIYVNRKDGIISFYAECVNMNSPRAPCSIYLKTANPFEVGVTIISPKVLIKDWRGIKTKVFKVLTSFRSARGNFDK